MEMNYIWNKIDKQQWGTEKKIHICILLMSVLFGAAGFLVWSILQNWCLSGFSWCVIFTGYPIVISWFIVFVYSCRHDFH